MIIQTGGQQIWQKVQTAVEEGRWDEMLAAAQELHAYETGGEEPRCPSCGEPWRLLNSGRVGHSGDERGNDCPDQAAETQPQATWPGGDWTA